MSSELLRACAGVVRGLPSSVCRVFIVMGSGPLLGLIRASAVAVSVRQKGRLAHVCHEGASRPLLGENLHAEALVTEMIARSGEFGAAGGEVDAENSAVHLQ